MAHIYRRFRFWLAFLFAVGFVSVAHAQRSITWTQTQSGESIEFVYETTSIQKNPNGSYLVNFKISYSGSLGFSFNRSGNISYGISGLTVVIVSVNGSNTSGQATASYTIPAGNTSFTMECAGGNLMVLLDCLPQTLDRTLYPPGPVKVGTNVEIDVIGKLNPNRNYSYSMSPTVGATISGSSSAGDFAFVGAVKGTYTLTFWVEEGNGYCRSNNITATIEVLPHVYCVEFLVKNPTNFPLSLRANQSGLVIQEYTLMPGDAVVPYKITGLETTNPVTLEVLQYSIYDWDPVTKSWWRPVGGYVTKDNQWDVVDVLTPSTACDNVPARSPDARQPGNSPNMVNPDPNAPSGTITTPPVWKPSDPVDARTGNNVTGTVWNTVNNSTVNNNVTNNTFIEGISKIEKQAEESNSRLDNVEKEIKNTNDKLDQTNDKLGELNGKIGGLGDKLDGVIGAIQDGNGPSQEELAAAAAGAGATGGVEGNGNGQGSGAAKVAAGNLVPQVAQPAAATVSTTAPSFVIALPAAMGGQSVDLNPFRSDRFGGIVDWFRAAVAWSVVISFALWASFRVKEWVVGVSGINQAKGNPIIGGTGAQATALIAAGAITVAVSVFMVALIAFLSGEFALTNLLGVVGVNPTSGMWATSAWMLDRCFPIGLMVSAVGARVAWNFYASSIFSVCTAAIRFIVP